MCNVASTWATASPRCRMPFNCAGMTFVSLNTSRSPGVSRSGRSRTLPVLKLAAVSDHKQPRRIARLGWPKRDAVFWQFKVKQIDAHVEPPTFPCIAAVAAPSILLPS